jgi:hypothetical protein
VVRWQNGINNCLCFTFKNCVLYFVWAINCLLWVEVVPLNNVMFRFSSFWMALSWFLMIHNLWIFFFLVYIISIENKASQMRWPCQYVRHSTSTYCVHTLNTKKIHSSSNNLNTFTQYEIGSNKVKLPKVGLNVMVPVPVGPGPTNMGFHTWKLKSLVMLLYQFKSTSL